MNTDKNNEAIDKIISNANTALIEGSDPLAAYANAMGGLKNALLTALITTSPGWKESGSDEDKAGIVKYLVQGYKKESVSLRRMIESIEGMGDEEMSKSIAGRLTMHQLGCDVTAFSLVEWANKNIHAPGKHNEFFKSELNEIADLKND